MMLINWKFCFIDSFSILCYSSYTNAGAGAGLPASLRDCGPAAAELLLRDHLAKKALWPHPGPDVPATAQTETPQRINRQYFGRCRLGV